MIDPWRGVAPCGPAKNQKSAMTCRHSRQLSDMPLSIVCAGDKRQQDSGKASTRHSQRRVMLITAKRRFLQAYRERTGWFTARKSIWLEMQTFPGRIIRRIEAGPEISPVD
ncbi:hypothetical protein [Brucella abortus]|uniref:hypothetical protein n=1 Tax=Brucella abortus TaxID=235 RepID=UPI0018C7380F|nr:hypothetical protein [Brucella abortus]MBI1661669.1 hypothetical protein [Brucella abortus]